MSVETSLPLSEVAVVLDQYFDQAGEPFMPDDDLERQLERDILRDEGLLGEPTVLGRFPDSTSHLIRYPSPVPEEYFHLLGRGPEIPESLQLQNISRAFLVTRPTDCEVRALAHTPRAIQEMLTEEFATQLSAIACRAAVLLK